MSDTDAVGSVTMRATSAPTGPLSLERKIARKAAFVPTSIST
jgi:hypothetical protein